MKKYRIFNSLIACLLLFSSCDKYLDLAPIDEIGSNGFYENTQEVEAGVVAIYDGMQDMVLREFALTEMRSDNTLTKNSEGEWAQFEDMNVAPTNATVSEYWTRVYNVIYRANTVLENLGAVEDETTKAQFEAEAKFARALGHFNLVRAFGDVPLITATVGPEETDFFSKRPASESYTLIESDLTFAVANLPTRSNTGEGRATKGAAQTLLAKMYLTLGDHSGAKTLLADVVGSGDYDLEDDYNDVFYSELNDEIVFAIQYITDDDLNSEDFSYQLTWKGRAGGLNYPTADFIATVDAVNDTRYNSLFYFEAKSGSSGRLECGKFRATDASSEELGGNDWIVLRYADVLLMQAEAIMGDAASTTDATALAAFNAIRTRAGLATVSTLTKDLLLAERRVELAYENHRLYDLVRFGKAEAVMGAFSQTAEADFNFKTTALLLPIPQREINVSNGLLGQNDGY